MTKEPSMEDILSSIKRIIAEDGDEQFAAQARGERRVRPGRDMNRKVQATQPPEEALPEDYLDAEDEAISDYVDEILELTDEAPRSSAVERAAAAEVARPKAAEAAKDRPAKSASARAAAEHIASSPAFQRARTADAPAEAAASETPMGIVSQASEAAARSSLAALSSMLVKPTEEAADNTLEGLVREMLRPMLKDWLDTNLPTLVEGLVAKEIARITGRTL